ncbi:MAG: slipin family protein [Myxococcota bacterium]
MLRSIRVQLHERVVLLRHSLPQRALAPGRHWLWGNGYSVQRFDTTDLLFRAMPEVRAVLPRDWFAEVKLDKLERAVLYRDGAPLYFLRPGTHRYWTVDASVRLEIFDVRDSLPALTQELEALIPRSEYVAATVQAHEKGLLYTQGRIVRVLEPGRYRVWTHPEAETRISNVDMRRTEIAIAGQDLMTRDKVSLRLNLSAAYTVQDPVLATQSVASVKDTLYLAVQLAAREYLAGVSLDELLEGRDAFTRFLAQQLEPQGRAIGVRLDQVGVKDVVLPGEMKTLLNRVIEAEKSAAANVILRREETAATRSLVNTARLMADQPILMRLKELEAMKDIATQIKEVRVVVGSDQLKTLLPAELLGRSA